MCLLGVKGLRPIGKKEKNGCFFVRGSLHGNVKRKVSFKKKSGLKTGGVSCIGGSIVPVFSFQIKKTALGYTL